MQIPFSIRYQPWSSFDRQSYYIFTDEFCHQSQFTLKANTKKQSGQINLKQQWSLTEAGAMLTSKSQIKLWFPLIYKNNGFIYFKSGYNKLKIHYDGGVRPMDETIKKHFQYLNFYGSFQSNKNLDNKNYQFGVNFLSKNWLVENRLEILPHQQYSNGDIGLTYGNKFTWASNNWLVNLLHIVKFHENTVAKNAIRVGYKNKNHEIFFRALNNEIRPLNRFQFGSAKSYFTKFIFDYVCQLNPLNKFAIECELNPFNSLIPKISGAYQISPSSKMDGKKVKVSSADKSIAFVFKKAITSNFFYSFGFELSDIGNTNQTKIGGEVEFNLQ